MSIISRYWIVNINIRILNILHDDLGLSHIDLVSTEPHVTYLISRRDTPVSTLNDVPMNETHNCVLWTADSPSYMSI